MNFRIINKKAKTKIICFLVIISFLISLIFPSVSNATKDAEENSDQKFSIVDLTEVEKTAQTAQTEVNKTAQTEVDKTSCPETLIVKLGDEPLFCVQDTELELPDENDPKYWKKEKEILEFEAQNFTTNINKFANTKKDEKKLIFAPDCEDENNCLIASTEQDNYYYLRIVYQDKSKYFDDFYNKEIIKIGKKSYLDIDTEWKKNKDQWLTQREQVRKCIKNAIKKYRQSFKLDLTDGKDSENNGDGKDSKNNGDGKDSENNGDGKDSENIKLSNQAVRIKGGRPIFYIRTWNKGLSPSERALRVSKKIEQIIEGEIDIQGLGIFEPSTENIENERAITEHEEAITDNSKVIKIISDSKFLSESDKNIIEVTEYDALFEKEKNAAELAKTYLIEINNKVDEYKNNIPDIEKRGYLVKFLKKPLFSINSGDAAFHQASYRASEISDRIEMFAQKNIFLNPDKLVVAYPVEEGSNSQNDQNTKLCILPESLNGKDYQKFLKTNSNPDYINKDDCQIEKLENNKNLAIIYSNEITKKIHQGDWQLTNLSVKRKSSEYSSEELPHTIIFMELNHDYEDLMNIHSDELDPILHENYQTIQELSIYFLNQIKNEVAAYTYRKRILFTISIVLLLIVLQLFFRISSIISQVTSRTRMILFEDISVNFSKLCSIVKKYLTQVIDIFHPSNKRLYAIFIKLLLLATIISFTLFTIPQIDIYMIDIKGMFSGFLENQIDIIYGYISTQVPTIVFILISVFILDKIIAQRASQKEKIATQKGEKTLIQSHLTIFRIILFIFTVILISPHLPAAGTIYFKGISAFAVLAFTWSASSVISDLASGIIIIYGRSLKTEDWIKVGDTIGEIQEQNLFFHRIKTPKNCIRTIPNSFILSNCTTNLSTSCNEKSKLILHTPVGLGYDLSRELVETTLIGAALKTDGVIKNIADYDPFVLITNLGDFAVTYELNVYTDNPKLIPEIYSDLQKNIQDDCFARGIEILSPNYLTLRFDEV